MNINDEDKSRLKEIFSSFMDLEDQKKELGEQQKDLKDEASRILEVKKGVVSKIFGYMKKKYEKGDDELEQIYEIMEQVES